MACHPAPRCTESRIARPAQVSGTRGLRDPDPSQHPFRRQAPTTHLSSHLPAFLSSPFILVKRPVLLLCGTWRTYTQSIVVSGFLDPPLWSSQFRHYASATHLSSHLPPFLSLHLICAIRPVHLHAGPRECRSIVASPPLFCNNSVLKVARVTHANCKRRSRLLAVEFEAFLGA